MFIFFNTKEVEVFVSVKQSVSESNVERPKFGVGSYLKWDRVKGAPITLGDVV